jgi:1,4-alpha-glucan branching enzyme
MSADNGGIDRRLLLDSAAARALATATVGNPFALLGPHADADGVTVRAFLPKADAVELLARGNSDVLTSMRHIQVQGLFAARLPRNMPYRLRIHWPGGAVQETEDPYAFGLLLGPLDLHLIAEGRHYELSRCLGAQMMNIDGVDGVRFAVWAPNARRVSVVGDFNSWDGHRHPMRLRIEAGIWELFIPHLMPGTVYKYEILGPHGVLPLKSDPVALQVEPPPHTASIVAKPLSFEWTDSEWMEHRRKRQSPHAPLSIYEVHAGSWKRADGDPSRPLQWDELASQLIPYVVDMGFTHIELLPITAHPFNGSWGYQPLGLFAPHAPHGEPAALARFVDRCHAADIGVIIDWVPAHFPTDAHGLARFDGTALYEHEDPREGFHQDWNTLIYNLGRREVHGFALASALHWLERYHIDGLRVDAVASMLYRDYSRRPGEWIPNRYGGRENLEAIAFLRHLNEAVAQRCPGTLVIAEESTAWPGVTHSVREGGLGFSYKWNMGWMHDTLRYLSHDPIHRSYHHDNITFGLVYAFSERFILPLSHDEVVHGKGSLIGKMPGDRWQRFATLRAYFGFMWAHPGKKLLFMGNELAQAAEWNHDSELDWAALDDPLHRGIQLVVRNLNRLHAQHAALHIADCEGRGFHWIAGDDKQNSVFAFYRSAYDEAPPVIAVCNFTPVPRHHYRFGAPRAGHWREIFNSDAAEYGGSGVGNGDRLDTLTTPSHGQPFSIEMTLPPLATVLLVCANC